MKKTPRDLKSWVEESRRESQQLIDRAREVVRESQQIMAKFSALRQKESVKLKDNSSFPPFGP